MYTNTVQALKHPSADAVQVQNWRNCGKFNSFQDNKKIIL